MTSVDVVIVGAGLSGIGAAARLELERPGTTYAVLEARGALGGTWDLFRYPGIRSDSDMLTLGYPFRPWLGGQVFADGPSIRQYVEDTATEYGVDRHVRLHHRVTAARWSSDDARWTVTAVRDDTGEVVELTCSFLYACAGYYRYDHGHEPHIPGRDDYAGTVVHAQHWPDDLDVSGRTVVVVGSGATAITLVPALADLGAHVVMLQRSPTYVAALPSRDRVADLAHRVLPPEAAYRVARAKSIGLSSLSYQLSRRFPQAMRRQLVTGARRLLPEGYDVERHFGPRYAPWDQRLCVAPDGDLFDAISSGSAEVVTDTIDRFTARGLLLSSGDELAADIVVLATGLEMQLVGGLTLEVDGEPVDPPSTVAYKGLMLSGVPNFAFAMGYTNASWTLRCDLASRYVCRVLEHLEEGGYDTVTPLPPPDAARLPLLDLTSGYVQRAVAMLPKQGVREPWRVRQNYRYDRRVMMRGAIHDNGVRWSRRARVRA
jgi:cation diffusion facilitator CzcD-associated flavoprotein CzcO